MPEHKLGQFAGTTLTNVRVRQRYKNLVKSALLSKVDGVALVYRSYPFWLIAAVVVAVLSLIVTVVADKAKGGVFVAGLVVAGILAAIYFGTRYVVLEICAGELVISESVKGDQMEQSIGFIDALENAQQDYQRHSGSEKP